VKLLQSFHFLFLLLFISTGCDKDHLEDLSESLILGCTDKNAVNYNALAEKDNGNCALPNLSIEFTNIQDGDFIEYGEIYFLEADIQANYPLSGYEYSVGFRNSNYAFTEGTVIQFQSFYSISEQESNYFSDTTELFFRVKALASNDYGLENEKVIYFTCLP
jgi:hypothetical protein